MRWLRFTWRSFVLWPLRIAVVASIAYLISLYREFAALDDAFRTGSLFTSWWTVLQVPELLARTYATVLVVVVSLAASICLECLI